MAKNRRLSGWNLVDDDNWKERLKEIAGNRPVAPYVQRHEQTLPSPLDECNPDCPICHGKAFYIDSQECAIECPNARRKLNGGDD